MQRAAEANVEKSLQQIEARRAQRARNRRTRNAEPGTGNLEPERLEAALVALDPATGEVRALVGGRDFKSSHFNRATQALRQPGSAFKPFVYAAALEAGYSPSSLVTRLDEPIQTLQGAWMPEDEHSEESAMTVRTALRTSSNRAAVRMLEEVGIARAVAQAREMGMGNVPSVPSLALGSGEVTLMAMTSAFAAFADQGRLRQAKLIRRVEDAHGVVLYQSTPVIKQVLSPQTAFLMTSMLSDVINSGTAYRARQEGFTLPAAGKTGTTNDYVDAWFVGYTPKLVTGVWVGFDKPRTIIANGFAGELAVPMWARFMKQATLKDKAEPFASPKGITAVNVCRLSGKLPGPACDRIITEYFRGQAGPIEPCDQHYFFLPPSNQIVTLSVKHGSVPIPQVTYTIESPSAARPESSREAAPAARVEEKEEPPKKRGLWGRLFGRRARAD
jgi:penicillin-binding protein 1A